MTCTEAGLARFYKWNINLPGSVMSTVMPTPTSQNYLLIIISLLFAVSLSGCQAAPTTATIDGVYRAPKEVRRWTGESLLLSDGRFMYWTYSSELRFPDPPDYPIKGRYRIEGDQISFEADVVVRPRYLATINGRPVLLSRGDYEIWKDEGTLYNYSILIKVSDTPSRFFSPPRPSLAVLKPDGLFSWGAPFIAGQD